MHPIDVRVVSATNINIEEKIRSGQFRSDLYYRLNLLDISIPPLRERREDVQELVDFYLTRFACEMGKRIPTVTPEAAQLLMQYDWPGNVRELRNVCERLIVLNDSDFVSAELFKTVENFFASKSAGAGYSSGGTDGRYGLQPLKAEEKKKELAEELGVSRTTLWRMAKRQSELEQKAAGAGDQQEKERMIKMELNYGMSLEQKQQLSQNQIQSLEVLAMDSVELSEFLQDGYLENPLLDYSEEHAMPGGRRISGRPMNSRRCWNKLRRYCGGRRPKKKRYSNAGDRKHQKLYSGAAAGWSMQPETGRSYDRLSG